MSLSSHLDRNLILLFVYSLFDLISEYTLAIGYMYKSENICIYFTPIGEPFDINRRTDGHDIQAGGQTHIQTDRKIGVL